MLLPFDSYDNPIVLNDTNEFYVEENYQHFKEVFAAPIYYETHEFHDLFQREHENYSLIQQQLCLVN